MVQQSPSSRPLVLVLVDAAGWAHDHKSQALCTALEDDFHSIVRYGDELSPSEVDAADAVVVHYWRHARRLDREVLRSFRRHREKVVIGTCSHGEVRPHRGVDVAGFVNEHSAWSFGINRTLCDEASLILGRPVEYLPNGVDTRMFRPASALRRQREVLRIGWTGSLRNHGAALRGLDDVVRPAFDGLEGVELDVRAREDEFMTHAQVASWMRELDVYVCASSSEGSPNTVLEAAASGLAVISTPVGNVPEWMRTGWNGVMVERSVEAFRDAGRTLRRRSRRAMMGRAARRTMVRRWQWKHQAERYRRLLQRVVERAG